MALATIECPVCHAPLDLHYGINIGPEIVENKDGSRSIEPKINFNIHRVESADTRIVHVLEAIGPSIKPGLEISELHRILREEYNVCQVHLPAMTDRVKEAYQLYSPDGKTLEMIK